MESRFIYEDAPFPQCHAATLAESGGRIVASWFGGTREKHADVCIWVSLFDRGAWSRPVLVADGRQSDGSRLPTWNPVLFQPVDGPLQLYYKVGPNPREWWGMKLDSADAGLSWSEPQALPEGILGPIKNKPIQLADSTVLSPSSTEDKGWTVHVERSTDNGRTWSRTPPLNRADEFAAIQPTFLQHSDGVLQMLCRTRQGVVSECRSRDNGRTWSEMQALALPNPDSGIDAVTLADGRHLLVYNPVSRGRSPLSLAVSDDGNVWRDVAELESEPGAEFSYPAIVQAATGTIHIAYTHKRTRIRHVTLTPDEIP